ncbi:MAG TPA: hypothetical protein ENN67_06690 [Firmicutes bacterium]|nr:hypothetical protein [Bacillota bacterium]
MALTFAWNSNRDLIGGPFPESYEELLSAGLLPIKFHNRFTGEPIKDVPEYSPGDLYFSADKVTGVLVYSYYMGEQDQIYNPSISEGKFVPFAGEARYAKTDGKTIAYTYDLSPDGMEDVGSNSYMRETSGMPADDDARASIFALYQVISKFMYKAAGNLDGLPATMDDFIAIVGEKNPVAWTNPYTGQPMREVESYDVPLYYNWERLHDPIEGFFEDQKNVPVSVVGNFSYELFPSPVVDGEMRAYAKFYFKEPDGSISAYLAIALGPEEASVTAWNLD